MRNILLICVPAILLLSCGGHGKKQGQSFVTDSAHILTDEQFTELNKLYTAHEEKTGNEIALVTIDHLEPGVDIKDYGKAWFNKPGVHGLTGKDNGVLILFCSKCPKVEILRGTGAEKMISHDMVRGILRSAMIPKFTQREYYDGILAGSNQLISLLEKPENKVN